LVNSASVFQAADLLDVTVDDWEAVMAVNLRAPFLCSQHAARMMQSGSGDGVIINIADIAGQVSWVRFPHHSVSKAGLIMLTRVLAKSLGPGIRANAVVPGPVMKPEGMPDVLWQALGDVLPLGRTGSPQNVVQAVLALVENDFITGTILNVDGGDALIGSVDVG
jgi:pteridine reductase